MNLSDREKGPSLEDLLQADENKLNQALKLLYENKVVRIKIDSWLQQYPMIRERRHDILQQAILILLDNVLTGKYGTPGPVRNYFISICHNVVRNHSRTSGKIDLLEDHSAFETPKADEPSADAGILQQEQTEAVNERDQRLNGILTKLTPDCEKALRLVYFELYSRARIAKEMGLKNENQAKKKVHRCRQALRDLIRKNSALEDFLKRNI